MSKVKQKRKNTVIIKKNEKFYCDGESGDSGHPKVYLIIGENEKSVLCPYCGKSFVSSS